MKQFRLILILWLCMAMNAKANETTANLLQQGDSCLSRYDVFHATITIKSIWKQIHLTWEHAGNWLPAIGK